MPASRTEATRQAVARVNSDEEQLTALLKGYYGESKYAFISMQTFGDPDEDEDDTFVLTGILRDSLDGVGVIEVVVCDVYVRLGSSFHRQTSKGARIKPRPIETAEASKEAPDASPEPAPDVACNVSWWRALWFEVDLWVHMLVAIVMGILIFAGLVEAEATLAWYAFVFVWLATAEFGLSLHACGGLRKGWNRDARR